MTSAKVVPKHIGFTVDGNRRWAKSNRKGLSTATGHEEGLSVIRKVVQWTLDRGVEYVTFYVFSTENWSRTEDEVGYLMGMAKREMGKFAKEMHEKGVRLAVLGSRERVDPEIVKFIDEAEALTAGNTNGTVGICFNYGGQQEIVDAVRKLVADGVDMSELTIEGLRANLYHPELPDLDMVVRTSGEERLSGFMLWRLNYAEIMFIEKNWPDITEADVENILEEYTSRERRHGK